MPFWQSPNDRDDNERSVIAAAVYAYAVYAHTTNKKLHFNNEEKKTKKSIVRWQQKGLRPDVNALRVVESLILFTKIFLPPCVFHSSLCINTIYFIMHMCATPSTWLHFFFIQ